MVYGKSNSEDAPKELFILSGELRGVSVPLAEEEIRLGSSSDCDVVLLDEFGERAEVLITPSQNGSYAFEAVAGSVRVGRRYLKVGRSRSVSDGVPIVVGDVEMALASSLENADRSRRVFRRRASGAVWAASIALGLGLVGLWGISGGPGSVIAKSLPTSKVTYVLDKDGPSQSMVAAKEFQKRLDETGFSGLNVIGDQDEHMVIVVGKLRSSDRSRWLESVEWFDQSFGRSVYLDAKISTMADEITLPFSIEAVWIGSVPRVTLHDGSKRTVGDELPGGWVLDAVAQESVTISKDDETLDVAL